ncbi:MAG: hypothetical protein IK095_05425 [Oscillospiraceae bacterium]|nr:hypothetical protein [Oscillospiraceae bacterium]
MKIWIVCTGEAEGLWPARCDAQTFEAAARRAVEEVPADRGEKKISGEGRTVYCAPLPAARRTAELCVAGGELRKEPLLTPVELRAFRQSGEAPLWLWRTMARVQRACGSDRQPESRKQIAARAEALFRRLDEEERDCILIADCILTEHLLDRARVRGYTMARTGIFRYRPWERILITRRDIHCGGCAHNCLLDSPGCGVGRDKAARKSG